EDTRDGEGHLLASHREVIDALREDQVPPAHDGADLEVDTRGRRDEHVQHLTDRGGAAPRLEAPCMGGRAPGGTGEDLLHIAPVPGGAELADNRLGVVHGGSLARPRAFRTLASRTRGFGRATAQGTTRDRSRTRSRRVWAA